MIINRVMLQRTAAFAELRSMVFVNSGGDYSKLVFRQNFFSHSFLIVAKIGRHERFEHENNKGTMFEGTVPRNLAK